MSMTSQSQISIAAIWVLLLLVPLLLWWFARRVSRSKVFPLRSIPTFQTLRGLLGRVAESGRLVHFSLGSAALGGDQTAAISAGLTALHYMADQGASFGFSPIVTVADPMLMLVAQDIMYRAYQRAGLTERYQPTMVQMIAPDPTAYAVGAQDTINQEAVSANVMLGPFGDEYLLLGEAGAQRSIVQLVGSNVVQTQPFMLATSDRVLVGEELFAAGAYLSRRPEHVASLQVQDVLRVLIVVAILVGVLIKTLA
jgi:hypothetical protein